MFVVWLFCFVRRLTSLSSRFVRCVFAIVTQQPQQPRSSGTSRSGSAVTKRGTACRTRPTSTRRSNSWKSSSRVRLTTPEGEEEKQGKRTKKKLKSLFFSCLLCYHLDNSSLRKKTWYYPITPQGVLFMIGFLIHNGPFVFREEPYFEKKCSIFLSWMSTYYCYCKYNSVIWFFVNNHFY